MTDTSVHELDRLAEELTLRRIVGSDGSIFYYNDNFDFHRNYGPAIIYPDGTKCWYQNGELHRLDGPAVIYSNGEKVWYINHAVYTEEEFNAHPLVVQYRAKTML